MEKNKLIFIIALTTSVAQADVCFVNTPDVKNSCDFDAIRKELPPTKGAKQLKFVDSKYALYLVNIVSARELKKGKEDSWTKLDYRSPNDGSGYGRIISGQCQVHFQTSMNGRLLEFDKANLHGPGNVKLTCSALEERFSEITSQDWFIVNTPE